MRELCLLQSESEGSLGVVREVVTRVREVSVKGARGIEMSSLPVVRTGQMARSGSVDEGQKEGHFGHQRGAGSEQGCDRDPLVLKKAASS